MKIILAGGGSGGPVAPLAAVAEEIKRQFPQSEFLLIGSDSEIEKKFAQRYNYRFAAIAKAKWRRYFSLSNFLTPFLLLEAFFQSLLLIKRFKPDALFGAGGYAEVAVMAAAFALRKKIIIHQQDILPSLSNKIIAPVADLITVSFEHSLKDFYAQSGIFSAKENSEKIIFTGNPFRADLLAAQKINKLQLKEKYGVNNDYPVILFIGGATGAANLNKIIEKSLPELTKYAEIIHITGKGKGTAFKDAHYHSFEFIAEIGEIYAIADIVVARGGLSTITELSALQKSAIVVPMPQSHQEANAMFLAAAKAAICVLEKDLSADFLVELLRKLIANLELQKLLQRNISMIMPKNADKKIAQLIIKLCQEKQ